MKFHEAWLDLVKRVYFNGKEVKPRGIPCVELLHTQLVVDDLRNNILVHPVRNLNYRFMVAEWLWIQAGREDVATIAKYNSHITKFSDDGYIFNGAYGPRLANQWEYVIENLKKDPDSRQAVMVIFTPNPMSSKDIPCTISLQVLLRDGKLHGIMTMRSNDLWLGLPYDFFNFSQITNQLAGELGVEPGSMTIQAGSSHLYEANLQDVKLVLDWEVQAKTVKSPQLKGLLNADWILREAEKSTSPGLTSDELLYYRVLIQHSRLSALEVLGG